MHSKSDNIEIMINDNADEIIEELFQLVFSRYQWEMGKHSERITKFKSFAYVSEHNLNCEKQVILLIITNREEWHYLAVKTYQHY